MDMLSTRPMATDRDPSPDVVLLGAEWKGRALIRAQLIEEGFEVVATDTWSMMRRHLRPGRKPRVAIVDLKGLDKPEQVLRDLAVLMKPERVLVLTAAATIPPAVVSRLGFRVLRRPVTIASILVAVRETLAAA
jgi:ActR/RegA family two-component response regulator